MARFDQWGFFLSALKQNQTYIWISSYQADTSLKSGCQRSLWSLLAELHQGPRVGCSGFGCIEVSVNTPPRRWIRSTPEWDTSARRHNIRGGARLPGCAGRPALCVCLLDWCFICVCVFLCCLCARLSPHSPVCLHRCLGGHFDLPALHTLVLPPASLPVCPLVLLSRRFPYIMFLFLNL